MPTIIRNALLTKVLQIHDLHQIQADFTTVTGMELHLVDELGHGASDPVLLPPLCRAVQNSSAGRELCRRTQSQLLSAATHQPACATCDAGLHEAAVPLRVGGIIVGYLRFAGGVSEAPDEAARHRIQHLLRKAGVPLDAAALSEKLSQTRVLPRPLLAACLRLLAIAANHLALQISAHLDSPPTSLPRIVEQACRIIRRRALVDDLRLGDVASECRVTPSHLSRVFHHATGLTFREYIAHWRAEHAQQLLMTSRRPVTEIAYESGFRSLSQFNRVFRAIHGRSPRQMRGCERGTEGPVCPVSAPKLESADTPNPEVR